MSKVCDMDCLNCIYDDCINDYIRPMHVITTEEDRISNRQSRKKRYEKLKQAGLCTDCGKRISTRVYLWAEGFYMACNQLGI